MAVCSSFTYKIILCDIIFKSFFHFFQKKFGASPEFGSGSAGKAYAPAF